MKICIFERSNEKNYFSKTEIYFYKKTTPQLVEHIGLQNIKVGGKTNLGDLPLFVWCMLTFAINIFYKSRNKTPVTLDRERCRFTCDRRILEKKNADTLRSKQTNNHRDLQIILKLLSSRQHEQRAWIIRTESFRVTQQMLVLRISAWKCAMAVSDDDNTILILFSG